MLVEKLVLQIKGYNPKVAIGVMPDCRKAGSISSFLFFKYEKFKSNIIFKV